MGNNSDHHDVAVMDAMEKQRKLYETIAEKFNVDRNTLNEETRFADLGADEHSLEELHINFEDAMSANRTDGKLELFITDFNGVETIGQLSDLILNCKTL